MHPQNCPHCNQHCLGFWSKLALGPARTKACATCGKKVSVPWLQSMFHLVTLGFIPLFVVLLSITLLDSASPGSLSLVLPVAGIVAGTALEAWLYYRFVPLVTRAN